MRWLLICVCLTALLAWVGGQTDPPRLSRPEAKLDRSRPVCIGPIRIGMSGEEVHELLGPPFDHFQSGEIYSERKAPQGPWRIELKNGLVTGLDQGLLTQDGRILLSVGDSRAKMLRVLGAPSEEHNNDESTGCVYSLREVNLLITLGGFWNSPDHVNWISVSGRVVSPPARPLGH